MPLGFGFDGVSQRAASWSKPGPHLIAPLLGSRGTNLYFFLSGSPNAPGSGSRLARTCLRPGNRVRPGVGGGWAAAAPCGCAKASFVKSSAHDGPRSSAFRVLGSAGKAPSLHAMPADVREPSTSVVTVFAHASAPRRRAD